jgi:hypothetical protein
MTREGEERRARKRVLTRKSKSVLSAWADVLNRQLKREIAALERPIEQREPGEAAAAS